MGLAASLTLGGCANDIHLPKSTRVARQDEAGTLLIAPTMVAPWADISASLKPAFALTGDQARTQVAPVTETSNQQSLTAVGAGLSAGLPTSATTNARTHSHTIGSNSTTDAGATTTTSTDASGSTSTTTTQRAPGVAPDLPSGTPAGGALPGGGATAPALGLDPILKYKAANNLFQEVQLLNQEVSNAASRDCYVPYVVKLKLTVVNYRPHVPYSVHSQISFGFSGQLRNALRVPRTPPSHPDTYAMTPWVDDLDTFTLDPRCAAANLQDLLPAVVPFLVTDDMQVAVKSRAAEAATQIATALSFMVQGVGAKAQFNAVRQSLTAISNHDLSSTLTIGRSADNAISAVINPNNQASGDPALVDQAYDVAVLVLVPRVYFGGRLNPSPIFLRVSSFTQYRDARTGAVLPPRDTATLLKQATAVLQPFMRNPARSAWTQAPDEPKLDYVEQLLGDLYSGSRARLAADLAGTSRFGGLDCDGPCIDPGHADSLWPSLAMLNEDEPEKVALLEAALPAPIKVPAQQVLLSDDGTHPVSAILSGVEAHAVSNLGAVLRVTPYQTGDHALTGNPVAVPATSLALDPNAHTLTLTFPSLKTLGISCLAPESDPPAKLAATAPTGKKGAKGKADAAAAKPAGDACPARLPTAGNALRPNNIELHLVGCDPGSQLCPQVTETGFAPTADSGSLTLDAAAITARQKGGAVDTLVDAQVKFSEAIKAWDRYLAMPDTTPEDKRARDAARDAASRQLDLAKATLTAAQTDLRSIERAVDWNVRANARLIGVTLLSSTKSTAASKLTLRDAGKRIMFKDNAGNFAVDVSGIPSGDQVGIVVTGAPVASVMDASGNVVARLKNGYMVSADGAYQITVLNLWDGAPVSVAVTDFGPDGKAKGDPVTKDYVARPQPQSSSAKGTQ